MHVERHFGFLEVEEAAGVESADGVEGFAPEQHAAAGDPIDITDRCHRFTEVSACGGVGGPYPAQERVCDPHCEGGEPSASRIRCAIQARHLRPDHPEAGVPALPVVEDLDVVENRVGELFFHFLQSRSSICILLQNDSINALPYPSPIVPIEPPRLAPVMRRLNADEANWVVRYCGTTVFVADGAANVAVYGRHGGGHAQAGCPTLTSEQSRPCTGRNANLLPSDTR